MESFRGDKIRLKNLSLEQFNQGINHFKKTLNTPAGWFANNFTVSVLIAYIPEKRTIPYGTNSEK
jgi:hypothetical protein